MQNNIYDVAILGAGVAGAFSAYKLSKYKDIKTCVIEFGRPPGKRRKQLQGWFGCFPYSNARLYVDDYKKVAEKTGMHSAKSADRFVKLILEEHGSVDISKNKLPSANILERITKHGYTYNLNNYFQWKPENIHSLSRRMAEDMEGKNIDFSFDNEVIDIDKDKNLFTIKTEKGLIVAKNIILAFGRCGWRFSRDIYKKFGIIKKNDKAMFGFRGEISIGNMSGWNKSHCTINNDKLQIGPLSWNGTVIPEDHYDLVISAWRSNEDRWKSEKVSFAVIANKFFENKGIEQTERLGKLAFILSDSRVGRLKVKDYIKNKFEMDLIPEYKWFKSTMKKVDNIIHNFSTKGYFYVPDIITNIPTIKINKKLSTQIEGMYVVGESAGINGILSAAISGCIAADNLI